jgi:hypothetical protein
MRDCFVDAMGNITVTGNLIRIDFIRMAGIDPEAKQAKFELSHRLVMPLEGFLRSLDMQEKVRQQLVKDGVLNLQQRPKEASDGNE